jgi:hypothetical protein
LTFEVDLDFGLDIGIGIDIDVDIDIDIDFCYETLNHHHLQQQLRMTSGTDLIKVTGVEAAVPL